MDRIHQLKKAVLAAQESGSKETIERRIAADLIFAPCWGVRQACWLLELGWVAVTLAEAAAVAAEKGE